MPTRLRQRLGSQMAADRTHAAPLPPLSRRALDGPGDRRGARPAPGSPRRRLPLEIAAARGLTDDQRELVVDDAIDYMVTEYAKPILAQFELDRAFWAAASFRVKRAHERRGATVRGTSARVGMEVLDRSQRRGRSRGGGRRARRAPDASRVRLHARRRVSAQVFAVKYGSGVKESGRNALSRALGLEIGEVGGASARSPASSNASSPSCPPARSAATAVRRSNRLRPRRRTLSRSSRRSCT